MHEIRVRDRLEREGFRVYKRGWPDFLAVKGDVVLFIEVKPPGRSRLSKRQRIVADVLKKLGIEVKVVNS